MKPHFSSPTHEEPKIVAAAEKQMRAWSRSGEIGQRLLSLRDAAPAAVTVGPCLAISREAGAGGSMIAQLVGQRLGWDVLGRALLDRVSRQFQLPRPMLELVDETKSNWAREVLGAWLDPRIIPCEKYVTCLRRVVLAAAQAGRVVFVGRGASFFLPRRGGLSVRIVASEPYRVRNLAARAGLDEPAARRMVRRIDDGRRAFVTRLFHCDVGDPHLYDLVINVERHGPAAVAEAIVRLCEEWFVSG